MEMFNVLTLRDITEQLQKKFPAPVQKREVIPISKALGRVISETVTAHEPVPHFSRSVVDGYAVRARDTFGAGESMPGFLTLKGAVEMGKPATQTVGPGETVYVPTGGALPLGADAVVMLEYVEPFGIDQVAVQKPASPLENVMSRGDDLAEGEVVLKAGTKLRPQDLGVLAAMGVESVEVYMPVRVSILSTGDEIVPVHQIPVPGQIRDINTYTIAALAEASGAEVIRARLIADDFNALKEAVSEALTDSDLVLLSGGSSVGEKDYTVKVLQSFGDAEILAHGLAVKPGKPTVVARVEMIPVFGLPGQPASAMMIFKAVVEPLIQSLKGQRFLPMVAETSTEVPWSTASDLSVHSVTAVSSANIHAAPGRTTFQMVTLENRNGQMTAVPVYGKSGMISLMSRAHGFIRIEAEQEGILQNEPVRVILF